MSADLNTHGYIMKAGRHRDKPITRVPISYLKWMINTRHTAGAYAAAELERRGTVTPDLDISGHALDRASLHCLDHWRATGKKDEGLHAWLARMAAEALAKGVTFRDRVHHAGMVFAFEMDCEWPVLKTVMRDNTKGV